MPTIGTPSITLADLSGGGEAWPASSSVPAGRVAVSPRGDTLVRKTGGTTRATFDATEATAWLNLSTGVFVNVRDYGAKGDGSTDDTAAILRAVAVANATRKAVFLPAGTYKISATIDMGAASLYGEGRINEAGSVGGRSQLVAATAGMTMLKAGFLGTVEHIALQGNNLANIGLFVGDGPRYYLSGIEIYRCRKSAYIFARSQNSTIINCFAQYSAISLTLANGARNNNFYNFTAGNDQTYYQIPSVPFADSCHINFTIDTNDPDYGGGGVTQQGNDRNNFFGGIFEDPPTSIKFTNLSGFTGVEAAQNNFYGVEFTSANRILDTVSGNPSSLYFDSCCFLIGTQDSSFGIGTNGHLTFSGDTFWNGANNNLRGISQESNYASLYVIDTDRDRGTFTNEGSGGWTYDATTRRITLAGGGGAVDGVQCKPSNRGNLMSVPQVAGKNSALATFTIVSVTGGNPVLVYVPLAGSPFRRQVGSYTTPGTYTLPIRYVPGDLHAISFTLNSNTQAVIEGVCVRSAGA